MALAPGLKVTGAVLVLVLTSVSGSPGPVAGEVSPSGDVPAPDVTSAAITQILESRASRVPELNLYKAAKVLGEANTALVEVRDLSALSVEERAAVERLARAENADRERMFEEIAAATGTDLSQLPRIREAYAATLREKARPGDWIQLPDGRWHRKEEALHH